MINRSLSGSPRQGAVRQHQVALVLCLVLLQSVAAEQLSVSELLDRYATNQDKLKSFIVRTEATKTEDVTEDGKASRSSRGRWEVEFRYEDDRGDFRAFFSPKQVHSLADGSLVPADRHYSHLWDRKRYIEHYRGQTLDESNVFVSFAAKDMKNAIAIGYPGPGSILGLLYGDVERFDSILKHADSISVRDELERVALGDCYVIDAKTKHGTYTIWLDAEHGYGIAKADVHREPKDLLRGRPLDSYIYAPYDISIRNVRFESIEGIWVPMEADFLIYSKGSSAKGSNIASVMNVHHRVTELLLNPDHNALGSFVPDIENGTEVRILDVPGITYTWQDGELVSQVDEYVIDEIDKMTEELMAEGQVPAGLEAAKKTEAGPNKASATVDELPDTAEAQGEILSESRSFPVVVLIPIGLLIIGVIAWRVFLIKKE